MSIVERSALVPGALVLSVALVPLVGCMPLDGRAERNLSAKEPTPAALMIDSSFADVKLTAGGSEVEVTASVVLETSGGNATAEKAVERAKVTVERDGSTLIVRQGEKGKPFSFSGNWKGQGSIVVRVPAGVPCTVATASGDCRIEGDFGPVPVLVRTASGDVGTSGFAAERVECSTASGDASFVVTKPLDAFTFSAASGDCKLEGGARKLEAKTASGDLRLLGLAGTTVVSTASGDVRLVFVDFPASATLQVTTASGDVDIELPAGADPAGSITTGSGDVTSDIPVALRKGSAVLTGSGAPIDLTTASGDLRIRRRSK